MVCSHSGILFSNKKEWSTDVCYDMDEPWTLHCMKETSHRVHILYDSIYMKWPEQAYLERQKIDHRLPTAAGRSWGMESDF